MKNCKLQVLTWTPPLLSLLIMILFCFIFYPGAMTWDSLEQLRQARLNEYTDWQPPIMAFVWHILLGLFNTPGVMLIFHLIMLYLASTLLYFWSLSKSYRWSWMFILIPFLPWVMNFEYVIWKDVGLAYSWLLAATLAIFYSGRNIFPAWAIITISGLFLYGCLVRLNSFPGALFLLPFLVACIYKKKSILLFIAISFCTTVIYIVVPKVVNTSLAAEEKHPASYVMFDDLAALTLLGVKSTPTIIEPEDIPALQSCQLIINNKVGAPFCINERFEDVRVNHYSELKAAWSSTVRNNTFKYLKFRSDAFFEFLRSPAKQPYYIREFNVVMPPYTFESSSRTNTATANSIIHYIDVIRFSLPDLFKPYLWLLASILLAALMKIALKNNTQPYWLLPLSGSLYTLGYLPVVPALDFRYVYWLCLIVTASLMILITISFKKER